MQNANKVRTKTFHLRRRGRRAQFDAAHVRLTQLLLWHRCPQQPLSRRRAMCIADLHQQSLTLCGFEVFEPSQ